MMLSIGANFQISHAIDDDKRDEITLHGSASLEMLTEQGIEFAVSAITDLELEQQRVKINQ